MDAIEQALYALSELHNGQLTPDIVVDAARASESPLHSRFTWDDTEAATKHRQNEARALIRSVKVEFRTEHFTINAPAFVRDPGAGKSQGYTSVGRLRTDQESAREAVVAEFSRASAALARAKAVAIALDLGDQISEIEGRIIHLAKRASQDEVSTSN